MTALPPHIYVAKTLAPVSRHDPTDYFVNVELTDVQTQAKWTGIWHRTHLEFEQFRRKLPAGLLEEFDRVTEAETQYAVEEARASEREALEQ